PHEQTDQAHSPQHPSLCPVWQPTSAQAFAVPLRRASHLHPLVRCPAWCHSPCRALPDGPWAAAFDPLWSLRHPLCHARHTLGSQSSLAGVPRQKERCPMSTTEPTTTLTFRACTKHTLTRACLLTEEDLAEYQGVITTREGVASFVPGDYVAVDAH